MTGRKKKKKKKKKKKNAVTLTSAKRGQTVWDLRTAAKRRRSATQQSALPLPTPNKKKIKKKN
jgi:hypothetical protein